MWKVNSRKYHIEESICGVEYWKFENTQLEEKKNKQIKSNKEMQWGIWRSIVDRYCSRRDLRMQRI